MESKFLGQFLLTGVPGTELDPDTARRFKALQPGGFILFGRNIKSPDQLRKLIDDLRDLSDIEPIITIDQEGGRVSRLRLIGAEPPNAQALRDKNDPALIRRHGELTGKILRLFGFNLNLCPVLDISYDDQADHSLKGRCYGRSPQQAPCSCRPWPSQRMKLVALRANNSRGGGRRRETSRPIYRRNDAKKRSRN